MAVSVSIAQLNTYCQSFVIPRLTCEGVLIEFSGFRASHSSIDIRGKLSAYVNEGASALAWSEVTLYALDCMSPQGSFGMAEMAIHQSWVRVSRQLQGMGYAPTPQRMIQGPHDGEAASRVSTSPAKPVAGLLEFPTARKIEIP